MSQAFYRKWRPHLWEEVVSQEHVVRTLQNAIRSGRFGHAYLFAGPRGTGKTSTARLLAKAVNCLDPDPARRPCDQCGHCVAVNEGRFLDLIEIDAASNTSVDDVRDLRDKINFAPSQGSYKVYIIDEVHMLSTAAFNALLKTLEEPPPHAIFILATTEAHKIPATVLSRCQRHEFRRIPVNDIVAHLKRLADSEKLDVEPEVLTLIARQSTGAMRDAISLLDQLASTGEKITLVEAQNVLGTATSQAVVELTEAILAENAAAGLDCIHHALDGGTDPRQFARQVVEYLRSLMLVRLGNAELVDATAEVRAQMAQHAQAFELNRLVEAIRLFNNAASETRSSWQPSLLLELALAEAIEGPALYAAPAQSAPKPQPQRSAPDPVQREQPRPARAPQPSAPPWDEPPEDPAPQPRPAAQQPSRQPEEPPERPRPAAEAGSTQSGSQPDQSEPSQAPRQPGEGQAVSLQDVIAQWKRISLAVRKRSLAAQALLNSCKPLTIKDNTLVLGFQAELLRDKMAAAENVQLTCQAIYEVLGCNLSLAAVVMNTKGGDPTDLDVDGDGMVGTALNLGGQIVHKE